MVKPLLTIIVPVYNVAKYLPKCLNSLINQTMSEIAIICVDDGSSDISDKVLATYATKDKRIKVVKQQNAGVSATRNTGLKHAKTEFIMWCDPDDYYEPEMCELMYQAISEHNTDIAACGTRVIYQAHHEMEVSDDIYYDIKFNGRHIINERIVHRTDVSVCNKIYRKSIIDHYKLSFPKGMLFEDYYFWFTYAAVCKDIYFIQDKLYNYLRRSGSHMSETFQKSEKALDHLKVTFLVYDFYHKHHLLEKYNNLFWQAFAQYYRLATQGPSAQKVQAKLMAKQFLDQHGNTLRQADKRTVRQVKSLFSATTTIKRRTRNTLGKIYRKISPSYRQTSKMREQQNQILAQKRTLNRQIKSIENKLKRHL